MIELDVAPEENVFTRYNAICLEIPQTFRQLVRFVALWILLRFSKAISHGKG